MLASAVVAWRYLQLHAVLAPLQAPPLAFFQQQHDAVPPSQYLWWSWWDQRYYLEAALAWSDGVLDPAYHWYLPGYPMLGALFARLTPAQPFLVPDLACFLAALWLFAGLAARVLAGMPYARSVGAVVFVATMALPERSLWAWVVPWTSTPQTPCILVCLLATAHFVERPRAGAAFAATMAGVATAAFRPADAAIVMTVSGVAMAWAMAGHRSARTPGIILAAVGGAVPPLVVLGGAYLVLYGWHLSPYVVLSDAIGFEWRLLPLRWVTLMIDPVPLLPDGRGLAAGFPWILPGVAGMAAALRRGRAVHGLVAGAALLDCLVFLIYRDLHPTGLWRLGNYHYFKWMLPVFGLYAVVWLRLLIQAPRLAVTAGLCVTIGLACWRVELTGGVALPASGQVLELPGGLPHLDDAVLAGGIGDLAQLYQPGSQIRSGAATFDSFADFKVFSWSNLFLVVPLRPLPAAPSTLRLAGTATIDPAVTPLLVHQDLVWGWPCWVTPARPVCRRQMLIPPPPLPDGRLSFAAGASERYQLEGWTPGDATGRWTEGDHASLLFAIPNASAITLTAQGYVPAGAQPVEVEMAVNGSQVGAWRVGPAPMTLTADLPPDLIDPDGGVRVDWRIVNPRRPSDFGADDPRNLGLFVTTLQITTPP